MRKELTMLMSFLKVSWKVSPKNLHKCNYNCWQLLSNSSLKSLLRAHSRWFRCCLIIHILFKSVWFIFLFFHSKWVSLVHFPLLAFFYPVSSNSLPWIIDRVSLWVVPIFLYQKSSWTKLLLSMQIYSFLILYIFLQVVYIRNFSVLLSIIYLK